MPFGFGAGAIQWTVSRTVASALSPYGDNTNDIGDATYRVRTGYFGTALAVGTNPATSGDLRLQSGFTLQARNAANAANGTILTTDALDFTKLSSNRVSSTVNTAMSLGATAEGFLFIEAEGDQAGAIFYLRGGGNGTTLISQFGNIWSVTAGSNAHFNVYWSAGNSRYELENNNLSTQFMRFVLVGF